uniref:UNC-50 family protein n=1 Tax=Oryza nivara TaxID=4536 RepID=A0A0E0IG49_ORYNI
MLPTTASKGRGAARSAPPLFGPYLRRIVKWQQMDIEYTFWQMVHLCTSPKVVYGESPSHAALTITSVVLVHFLFAGIVLATLCWFLTNSYLREEPNSHVVEQLLQYFLSPLLVAHGFFPALLSNLLFVVAISYYHYLNFLGYDVILIGFNPTRYFLSLYFR